VRVPGGCCVFRTLSVGRGEAVDSLRRTRKIDGIVLADAKIGGKLDDELFSALDGNDLTGPSAQLRRIQRMASGQSGREDTRQLKPLLQIHVLLTEQVACKKAPRDLTRGEGKVGADSV
jgi:hypothetical protein